MVTRRMDRLKEHAIAHTLLVAILVILLAIIIQGCRALGGLIFTSRTCNYPGVCGVSGHLLFAFDPRVSELLPGQGNSNDAFQDPYPAEVTGGLAFATTRRGLRLYVATTEGLADFDGRVAFTGGETVPVPDCAIMGDVIVLENGDVIVSCYDSDRLVRIDPVARTIVESFACCVGAAESFDPFALALRGDGTVLAGTTQINQFDAATGTFLGVAIEAGIMGAARYDDFIFGPNGNLFVSANQHAGVLEFDGETFEFVRVFVPAGTGGMAAPGPLAFNAAGELFVNGYEGSQLLRFDGETGSLLEEVAPDESSLRTFFMAFRP